MSTVTKTTADSDESKSTEAETKANDVKSIESDTPAEKADDKTEGDSSQPGPSSLAVEKSTKDPDDCDTTDDAAKICDENSHDKLIEIDDPDDYLLYLEEILKKIHGRFYAHHDETKQVTRL